MPGAYQTSLIWATKRKVLSTQALKGHLVMLAEFMFKAGYAFPPADPLPITLCFPWPQRNTLGTSGPGGFGVVLGIVSKQTGL